MAEIKALLVEIVCDVVIPVAVVLFIMVALKMVS